MTEHEWTEEEVRLRIALAWDDFQRDPDSVTPGYAGAIAHLRTFGLSLGAPDFLDDLKVVMCLLHHGIEHTLVDYGQGGAWRLSLAQGYAELAERNDSPADWSAMTHWAREAGEFPHEDEVIAEFTAIEVIHLYTRRAWWQLDTVQDETMTPQQVHPEVRELPEQIRQLSARLGTPRHLVLANVFLATTLGVRWFTNDLDDPSDLLESVQLMSDSVFLLDEDAPFRVEALVLFTQSCLELRRYDPLIVPYDKASAAVDEAIRLLGYDDPDVPGLHQLAATILDIAGHADEPEVRDRIITHLSKCADNEDPVTWEWYGNLLYDRASDTNSVEDYVSAVDWLGRYVTQQDRSEKFAWVPSGLITTACHELWQLTSDPQHLGPLIDHATRTLEFPLPEQGLVRETHWRRLCAVNECWEIPEGMELITPLPISEWLIEAEDLVGPQTEQTTDESALLAASTAIGWYKAVVHMSDVITPTPAELARVLDRAESMLNIAQHLAVTDPTLGKLLNVLTELMRNARRTVFGDGDADMTELHGLLADPEFEEGRDALHVTMGLLGSTVGVTSKALGPSRIAKRLFSKATGLSPQDRLEVEAYEALFDVFYIINSKPSALELRDKTVHAWELVSQLPDSAVPLPIKYMAEDLYRIVMVVDGELPTRPVRRESMGSSFQEAFSYGADIVSARTRGDGDALREICSRLTELVDNPNNLLRDGVDIAVVMRNTAFEALADIEPWNREALNAAIEGYAHICDTTRDKHNHALESAAESLAKLLRRRDAPGDRDRSRAHGLQLLWISTWKVLIQSGSEHALEIARHATAQADQLTSWCLTDGVLEDLVQVVDARRGLVLKAVGTDRTITRQLVDVGQHDLAQQWAEAEGRDAVLIPGSEDPEDSWGGLRRQVLRVLAQESDALATSPSIGEIQKALRLHGSGALVYLLPDNDHHDGIAVVVPADSPPYTLPLWRLRVGENTAIGRYQQAYDAWYDAKETNGEECLRWREELRALCTWAWKAAGKDLRTIAGQIVLVPVGPLGLVPWHAARNTVDGVDHYLVEDIAISYTPSARMFCDIVERADVEGGQAVLVGNPARDLAAGADEAQGIRDAFFPSGLFLGSFTTAPRPWRPSPDGAGTPDDMLRVLAEPLSLLHLASHAVADMRHPLHSYVRLAPSTPLSARTLLNVGPVDLLPLGLVNLAGCTTNASGVDYDEALSLSTTFLAIGARTVIGSMWRIPSGRTTTHLMFMFYHYRSEGLSAAEALRRAQLWMLDPERAFPDNMPPEIRKMSRAEGFDEREIECWAGFTSLGK